MTEIGLAVPPSGFAYALDEAAKVGDEVGYPVIVRPSFILGGGGTGIAADSDELRAAGRGRAWPPAPSPRSSSSGRSPGGRSTSSRSCATRPTTASSSARSRTSTRWASTPATPSPWRPAQTLSDVEYQRMRDAAFACIRRIGVDTGGSNIQFAVNPADGEMVVIEMNPRVSPVERPGVEGHRVPHRQDRRPAGRRLHARRDPQRHHPARRRPASSPPSTTSSPRSPAGRSRSSRARPTCSAPACSRWARPWPSAGPSPSRCRRACARSSTAAGA